MRLFQPSLLVAAHLALALSAESQAPTRDNYLFSTPPPPRILGQAAANERLNLFGDPSAPTYRDVSERDGVDDSRAAHLVALGEHFSPLLRRNTYNVPQDFEDVLGDRVTMYVDTWRGAQRIASASVYLGPPLTRIEPLEAEVGSGGGPSYPMAVAPDDAALEALLRELRPQRALSNVMPPEGSLEKVLFFDVLGQDEKSWREAHGRRLPERTRLYLHPFIHEVESPDERRYEFVLQYWFYYPYNDGGNNHEGDWEHVNVAVTIKARASAGETDPARRGLLTEAEIALLLNDTQPIPLDSLQIWFVDYYFHNNVMRVDYLEVAAGGTLWSRLDEDDGAIHVWEDRDYMDMAVRERLDVANGKLSTHPIGYIAGNNKGTDELLHLFPRFSGSFNRDSHGTYPFPGVWRKIGPLDATEKILGSVVPRVHADTTLAWYDVIDDEHYLVYRASDMILVPDWERLEPLVLEDPVVRRKWAWFVLPVHMGFPAVASPGAGALRRVDLGNIAPMSPAYNNSWNRSGVTEVYSAYHPHVMSVMFAPVSPLTSLKSGWGALNLPIVLWGLLPGGNVAVTQLLPWATGALNILGAPPGRTFYQGVVPDRFTGFGLGRHWQFGGHDFGRLLPEQTDPTVGAYLEANEGVGATIGERHWSPGWGNRVWLNLYYSGDLSVESTFSFSESEVSYPIVDSSDRQLATVAARLEVREMTGGVTYRLPVVSSEVFQPYVRAGYGWTSYSLGSPTLGGAHLPDAERDGGYILSLWPLRGWWPNTVYGGLGLELFSPPENWLLRRVGYGMRLEFTGLIHRLRAEADCKCNVTTERGDVALVFLLGW